MDTLAKIEDLDHPRVVIVGGGFAGLELARALRDAPVIRSSFLQMAA